MGLARTVLDVPPAAAEALFGPLAAGAGSSLVLGGGTTCVRGPPRAVDGGAGGAGAAMVPLTLAGGDVAAAVRRVVVAARRACNARADADAGWTYVDAGGTRRGPFPFASIQKWAARGFWGPDFGVTDAASGVRAASAAAIAAFGTALPRQGEAGAPPLLQGGAGAPPQWQAGAGAPPPSDDAMQVTVGDAVAPAAARQAAASGPPSLAARQAPLPPPPAPPPLPPPSCLPPWPSIASIATALDTAVEDGLAPALCAALARQFGEPAWREITPDPPPFTADGALAAVRATFNAALDDLYPGPARARAARRAAEAALKAARRARGGDGGAVAFRAAALADLLSDFPCVAGAGSPEAAALEAARAAVAAAAAAADARMAAERR